MECKICLINSDGGMENVKIMFENHVFFLTDSQLEFMDLEEDPYTIPHA